MFIDIINMVNMLTTVSTSVCRESTGEYTRHTCRLWVFVEVLDHSSVEGGPADSGSGCKRLHKRECMCDWLCRFNL